MMHCPKCGKKDSVKAGFVKGTQRYKCKHCSCQYTRKTPKGRPAETKLLAAQLYLMGLPIRSIASLLKTQVSAVFRWVKEYSEVRKIGEEAYMISVLPKGNHVSDGGKLTIEIYADWLSGKTNIIFKQPRKGKKP